MNERLTHMHYDESGREISPKTHRRLYPKGRKLIRQDRCLGIVVSTEFSGVNHNPDPDGEPRIFETIAHIDGAIYLSRWTSSAPDADFSHSLAKAQIVTYGWALWRAHYGARVARHRLRKMMGNF